MDTTTLKQILVTAMESYAGKGLNAESLLTRNDVEQTYAVIDFADVRGKRIISTVLVSRIAGDKIIIEVDKNSKPLVDMLRRLNVPDEQMVLAYHNIPA